MKYFARLRPIHQHPYNGEYRWCVVDSMGGYWPVKDEQTAVLEALRRNTVLASV